MSHEAPLRSESSQKRAHEQPSTQVASEPPSRSQEVVVQYIPVAVSEIQRMNDEGRTTCKVIGCLKIDHPGTNGFCTEHHSLFLGTSSTNKSVESADWVCVCGEKVSGKKKRCWNCSKWRVGSKKKNDSTKKSRPAKKTREVKTKPLQTENHMSEESSKIEIDSSDWMCICGENVSAKKKRCWNCSKWRGGSSRNVASGVLVAKKNREEATLEIVHPNLPSVGATDDFEAKTGKRKHTSELKNAECLEVDTDITKVRTSSTCASRWDALLTVTHQRKRCNSTQMNETKSDPFDCSDLIVPPNTEIIEKEAAIAIQKWNDLDSRIVLEDDVSGFFDGVSASADDPLIIDGTMVGDGRRQRLMPPNFDYKCSSIQSDDVRASGIANSDPGHQNHYRLKVISLMDPNQTLDYENELWHVFKSMPTAIDCEKRYGILDDEKQSEGPSHGLQHTFEVKQHLKAFMNKHTRMDAHSLGRLRMRDRHSIPPIVTTQLNQNIRSSAHTRHLETTVRFEVLRYSDNLTRGPRRDSTRLEVEFSGSSSTLFDVHRALVECAHGADGVSNPTNPILGGVFFIENNFYTHGISGEDAGRAIVEWLDGNQSEETTEEKQKIPEPVTRRKHLHISSSNSLIPMSSIYLEQLPFRLGIRYVHITIDQMSPSKHISLCNESALFVTDIQTHKVNKHATNLYSRAPIIHDKWMPLKSTTFCLACNTAVATIVTMNDELTSTVSSGTPMCTACFRDLHYQTTDGPMDELRKSHAHQSFRVLPIDSFNCSTVHEDMAKMSSGAVFKRF